MKKYTITAEQYAEYQELKQAKREGAIMSIYEMSIYEASKYFSKQQFVDFCEMLYNKGRIDGALLLDDGPWIRQRLSDFPYEKIDEIE